MKRCRARSVAVTSPRNDHYIFKALFEAFSDRRRCNESETSKALIELTGARHTDVLGTRDASFEAGHALDLESARRAKRNCAMVLTASSARETARFFHL